MSLQESFAKAYENKMDIVLRNKGTRPPIVKMMNYQKEIFKKLLVKLGNKFDESKYVIVRKSIKSLFVFN